jgi:diacylglycerol kinase
VGVVRSFKYALAGVGHILRQERNARIHLVIAAAVLIAGVGLNLSVIELAAIFFAIITVFLAEIANTALEETLDLVEPGNNEKVRLVKGMAAGAVLVAALGALAIGLVIFWPYLAELLWQLR